MTLLRPSVGLPDFWAGSGFEDKLLQAQGDLSLNAGQHSVTYLPSSDTGTTGRYQVLLYDNNFGTAESYSKFDWGQLGAAVMTDCNKDTHSFGRIFTVDEVARTYELEDQIAAPFSGYVSSAQRVGDSNSMLVASGMAKTFTEYDRYGLSIATTRLKPRSASTACASTSCSAALRITLRQIPRDRARTR